MSRGLEAGQQGSWGEGGSGRWTAQWGWVIGPQSLGAMLWKGGVGRGTPCQMREGESKHGTLRDLRAVCRGWGMGGRKRVAGPERARP